MREVCGVCSFVALILMGCGGAQIQSDYAESEPEQETTSAEPKPKFEWFVESDYLDPKQPPVGQPWNAFEREEIDPLDFKAPTYSELMDGEVAEWIKNLEFTLISGDPLDRQNVRTDSAWMDGKATLNYESKQINWSSLFKAHGYGEATYNSTGTLFAKVYYRYSVLHGPCTFYNEDGSIKSIRCHSLSAKGKEDGPYVVFEDGKVIKKGQFSNGEQSGIWTNWDIDGNVTSIIEWSGSGHQLWKKMYTAEGLLTNSYTYKNGQTQNPILSWIPQSLDNEGNITNLFIFGRLELICLDNDSKLHGWQTTYNKHDKFREFDLWFEHGEQTGKFVKYNKDRDVIQSGKVIKGVRNGQWTFVTKNPLIRSQFQGVEVCHMKDGIREGKYVKKTLEGRVKESGAYVKGKKHGEILKLEVSGASEFYTYANGVIEGPVKRFDSTGNEYISGQYKNGVMAGEWKFTVRASSAFEGIFDAPEDMWECVGSYAEGLRHGKWTWTQPDGKLGASGQYSKGKKTGIWKMWNKKGELTAEKDLSPE